VYVIVSPGGQDTLKRTVEVEAALTRPGKGVAKLRVAASTDADHGKRDTGRNERRRQKKKNERPEHKEWPKGATELAKGKGKNQRRKTTMQTIAKGV
jgi:hypothetical protein